MNKKQLLGLISIPIAFIFFITALPQAPQYIQLLAGIIILPIFSYELMKTHKQYKEKNQEKPLIHYIALSGAISLLIVTVLITGYFIYLAPFWLIGTLIGAIFIFLTIKYAPHPKQEYLPTTNKKYIKQYAVPLAILLFFFASFMYSSNERLLKIQAVVLISLLFLYRLYINIIGD